MVKDKQCFNCYKYVFSSIYFTWEWAKNETSRPENTNCIKYNSSFYLGLYSFCTDLWCLQACKSLKIFFLLRRHFPLLPIRFRIKSNTRNSSYCSFLVKKSCTFHRFFNNNVVFSYSKTSFH